MHDKGEALLSRLQVHAVVPVRFGTARQERLHLRVRLLAVQ
jgi:hypothetical protein